MGRSWYRGVGVPYTGGEVKVPDSIPDCELKRNPMWVLRSNGEGPVRDSMWLHEYRKDNYWNGEKMVWHTLRVILILFFSAAVELKSLLWV